MPKLYKRPKDLVFIFNCVIQDVPAPVDEEETLNKALSDGTLAALM